MVSKSKQAWTVGSVVKVGFVAGLTVIAAVATPGDGAPDAYVLTRAEQFYSFVPHNGLTKITFETAGHMISAGKFHAEKAAQAAIAKAANESRHAAQVAALLA